MRPAIRSARPIAASAAFLLLTAGAAALPVDFTRQTIDATPGQSPQDIIASDFDNDGDTDLFVALGGRGTVVFVNDGGAPPVFSEQPIDLDPDNGGPLTPAIASPLRLAVGNIDNFDRLDVAVINAAGDVGLFTASPPINWAFLDLGNIGANGRIAIANLDGDDDGDVIAIDQVADEVLWFENGAPFGFQPRQSIAAVTNPESLAVGDFDFDGDQDIVVTTTRQAAILFRNDGPGAGLPPIFTEVPLASGIGAGVADMTFADIDDDGDSDIVYAWTSGWRMLRNDSGVFNQQDIPDSLITGSPLRVGVADIDGDGDLDLFGTGTASGSDVALWWDNDGSAPPVFTERGIPMPIDFMVAVDAADLDDDGWLDLVASGEFDDTIAWWTNDTVSQSIGWAVTSGDFQNSENWTALEVPRSGDDVSILGNSTLSFLADAASSDLIVSDGDVMLNLAGQKWNLATRSDSILSVGGASFSNLDIDGGEIIARNLLIDGTNADATTFVTNGATLRLASRGLIELFPLVTRGNPRGFGAGLIVDSASTLIDSGDGEIVLPQNTTLSIESNALVEVREISGQGTVDILGGADLFFPDRFHPVIFDGDIFISGAGSSLFAASDLATSSFNAIALFNAADATFFDADIAFAQLDDSTLAGFGVLTIDDLDLLTGGDVSGGTLNVSDLDMNNSAIDVGDGVIGQGVAIDSSLSYSSDLSVTGGSLELADSSLSVGDTLTVDGGSLFTTLFVSPPNIMAPSVRLEGMASINIPEGALIASRDITVAGGFITSSNIRVTGNPFIVKNGIGTRRLNIRAGASASPSSFYLQDADSILSIELSDDPAPFPILLNVKIPSTAFLGGTLEVTRAPGFNPAVGERIDLIVSNTLSGNFDVVVLPGFGDNRVLRPVITDFTSRGEDGERGVGMSYSVIVETAATVTDYDPSNPAPLSTGTPTDVAIADFNQDSFPDFVVSLDRGPSMPGAVEVLFNAGNTLPGQWGGVA
ncbi:MAG: FG-GAP-like repeat-containing protein, partial [Planctomycetota bacterium]|nr:FG-GAP-like repeat-containing protein [Planctomycetota bacterium]